MNRNLRIVLVLAVLLISSAVAGCGVSGDRIDEARNDLERVQSVVDAQGIRLPTIPIPIDIGEDGRVTTVGGIDREEIDEMAERLWDRPLIGKIAFLTKDQLAWFKQSNIQHISVASRSEGLFVLVNGQPLPYLAWDEATVDNLVDVLGQLQEDGSGGAYLLSPDDYEAVKVALPLMQSLGVRFDVRFPRDPAHEEIPPPDDDDFDLALTDEEVQREPLQSVDMEIEYREMANGEGWVPAFFGFSTLDLQTLGEPLDLNVPRLRLRDDLRRRLEVEGIRTIGMESRADGLFVTVNGRLMPHVAWSEATLTNLSSVLWQLYPEGVVLPDDAEWVPIVRSTAPAYNDFDFAVLVRFPPE